jgi:hypothetical protein
MDGWGHTAVRLSADGARRIARQMDEWADAADKANEGEIQMTFRYVAKVAEAAEEAKAPDGWVTAPTPAANAE